MSVYPKAVAERARVAANAGAAENANAPGSAAAFECGTAIRFSMHIADGILSSAKYQTNGCGYMVAAAEAICERVNGLAVTDLGGIERQSEIGRIEQTIGPLPPERRHCIEAAIDAAAAALGEHRRRLIEEYQGARALICTCFGVSEGTIRSLIETDRLDSVEAVAAATKAGTGCGACRMLIREMIDSAEPR